MPGMRTLPPLILLSVTALLMTSCITYSVGTTARPVPTGEFQANLMVYSIPNGVESTSTDDGFEEGLSYGSADFEGRWGLSEKSDLGLRVPAGSGVIVNYKRLLNEKNDPNRVAFSALAGAGVVNYGNHAYVEGGFIASGQEDRVVPYGGMKAMHVVPISRSAVSDTPTIGAFGGMRIRTSSTFSISPEIGFYYDKPVLELRERNYLIVPSITFHWD